MNILEKTIVIDGENIVIRPITLEDLQREKDFVTNLSSETRHFRFLGGIRELSDEMATRFCDIDYEDHMAFVAVINNESTDNKPQEVGVSRYEADDKGGCECALTVADEWQNKGLGRALMDTLIEFARSKNKKTIYSYEMRANTHMEHLANDLHMKKTYDDEDTTLVRYELLLIN
ncbi:GNAT family N-acetyltransferase [Leucothrix arctica]|uniref:GNAT family N-acetyltransferase n=1 Tax=Leucothrix arctica TaxID=1481894 RepID=A0A317C5D3_9GAMM|nr:GNAT family N-acetyltransferase [Leucothrix arctica]PWQ93808.1 GNAT family N-acetyltransferase [Leucothrix arctica]